MLPGGRAWRRTLWLEWMVGFGISAGEEEEEAGYVDDGGAFARM